MADRTTFVEVADGDTLSEGYFNGIWDGLGRLFHLVAYDATQAARTTSGTLKSYSLSTTQTDFNILIFFVQGTVDIVDNKGRIDISPPDTADVTVLGGTFTGNTVRTAGAGMRYFVAGTDYTKGSAETFDIVSSNTGGGTATYDESIIIGVSL